MEQLLSKPKKLPQNKLMSLISWIWNITTHGYGFDVQRTSFYGDLSIFPEGQEWQHWFFSSFHSTACSPGLTILRGKNCALSESIYFLILYPTNIRQICDFLSSHGALNTSLWRAIFENINMGKLAMFWYCNYDIIAELGIIWIELKSKLLTTQNTTKWLSSVKISCYWSYIYYGNQILTFSA